MISLIIPMYSNKVHKYFLSKILEQTNQEFEMIVFTNNISLELTNQIKEVEDNSNIKLQVIFTTRKIGFNEVIIKGIKLSSSTHAIIINPEELLSKTFINDLNNIVEKNKDTDIFEFKASFKGFEKWTPQKRCDLKQNHSFKISEYPKIVAFTFPFISNKLFKVSLAKVVSKKSSYLEMRSHLSIEFLYMLFLEAETYAYINKPLCNIIILKEDIPNYMNFYKEWKNIKLKYSLENKFFQEIEYAQIFSIEVMIPLLYVHKKLINILFINSRNNQILLNKIYDKNKKIRESDKHHFNSTNKYMLLNSLETEYLYKLHPPNEWSKIIKIFRK